MTPSSLDHAVDAVVAAGNCSGCGLCAALDSGLEMRLSPDGFMRPVRVTVGDVASSASVLALFESACPGRRVSAQRPDGATWHPTMGPVRMMRAAWAADPELRRRGGSGGALTAIAGWLVARGDDVVVVGARQADDAMRTAAVAVRSERHIPALAGSRYAPVSNAALGLGLGGHDVFIGKPCEVSALRAVAERDPSRPAPLLLSFFCAGTPSQHATERLVHDLGMPQGEQVRELWYRGRGWPGRFTAVGADGTTVSASYEESWGSTLGRALQWRCRICPDGVAESADIVAADLWDVDAGGAADFTETLDGVSAVIARTERGERVLREAVEAGVVQVEHADVDALARVQPLQRNRRTTIPARLTAQLSSGGSIPSYSGFGLVRRVRPRDFVRVLRRARRQYRSTSGAR
jgi:coenzyme F420 hydrogenase subunit beta